MARAAAAPFGPCWLSAGLLAETEDEVPMLVSTLVTRRLGSLLLPSFALVDRTCLGIKDAFQLPPQTELDLERLVRELGGQNPMEKAELLVVQSVIFHALDYARSLGFEPHHSFLPELIGERPAQLLDTPFARPEWPIYIPGPEDDMTRVLAQLEARVGPDGYDCLDPFDAFNAFDAFDRLDDGGDDDLEDDSDGDLDGDDPAVLDVEGSEVTAGEASTTSTRPR